MNASMFYQLCVHLYGGGKCVCVCVCICCGVYVCEYCHCTDDACGTCPIALVWLLVIADFQVISKSIF